MHRPDPRTRKERSRRMPRHRQINRYRIALLHAERPLQDISDLADLAEEFRVGDRVAFAWFVGFVDDGGFVGVGVGPAVDAVVGGVEAAFGEPDDVAGGEGAGLDGVEGAVPVESFARGLGGRETLLVYGFRNE